MGSGALLYPSIKGNPPNVESCCNEDSSLPKNNSSFGMKIQIRRKLIIETKWIFHFPILNKMVETIPLRMVGNYTDGIGWELNRWSHSNFDILRIHVKSPKYRYVDVTPTLAKMQIS